MKKNVVRILTAVLMLSVVFSSSVFAAEKEKSAWESFVGLFSGNAVTVADTQVDGVTYRTHIENDGWAQGWVSDGDMSGSEGRGLRLEGIEIKIDGDTLPDGLGITYRTHIENDGWAQGWVSDGDMSGSEGRGLRLEGIEIKLTGENADDYTVLYRTHIENDGWAQGWVADGEMSGSEGRGLRLEGIEIKVEQKTADLTAYNAALAAVTQADYTAASWTAYQAVVAANVVTVDNTQTEVDAATANITAAQADLVKVLKVESVSAINADQIKVVFNKAVDKTTAEAYGNYTVKVGGNLVSWSNGRAQLLDDKMTVILSNSTTNTYANAASILVSGTAYQVTVENVTDTTFNKMIKYTGATTAFLDTAAPVVTKAEYVGGVVRVYFDEPANPSGATYKVDGGVTASISTSVVDKVTYYYEFTPNADQKTVGSHVVTLYAVKDPLNNNAPVLSATYTVSSDVGAPTVTSLTADTQSTFKVKFSEPLSGLTNANFTVKRGTSVLNVPNTVALDANDTSNTTWIVTVQNSTDGTNKLYPTGETTAALTVTIKNFSDAAFNVGAEYTGNVTLTKDTTGPAVINTALNSGVVVTGSSNDKLKIVFDKNINSVTDSKITVKKDGVILPRTGASAATAVTNDANGNPRAIFVGLGAELAQGTYTVELAAGAVNSTNLVDNAAATTYVNYANSNVYIIPTFSPGGTNVIDVSYSASTVDMSASAENISNYTLDGAALPAGSTVGFYNDKKTVRITLGSGTIATSTNAVLKVSQNVVNTNGEKVLANGSPETEATYTASITDNVKPTLTEAKYLVGSSSDTTTTKISLKFSESLNTSTVTTVADYKVVINGVEQTVSGAVSGAAGNRYVTLTLGAAVNVNQAATINIVPVSDTHTSITVADPAGNKAAANSTVTTSGTQVDGALADAAAVAADKAALAITYGAGETATTVKTDVALPTTGANGTTISWGSSAAGTVSTIGGVIRPIYSSGDATVTLTATISKGGSSDTKVFNLTVLKRDFAATAQTVNDNTFTITTDGYALTDFSAAAGSIEFDSNNTATVTVNGVVYTITYVNTTGIATVGLSGTTTGALAATTETINVIKDGKTATVTLNIPAASAAGETPVVTVS